MVRSGGLIAVLAVGLAIALGISSARAVLITVDGGQNTGSNFVFNSTTWVPHTGWVYTGIEPFAVLPGDTLEFDTAGNASQSEHHFDIAFGTGTLEPGGDIDDVVFDPASFTTVVDDGTSLRLGSTTVSDFDVDFTITAPYFFPGGVLVIDFSEGDILGVPLLAGGGGQLRTGGRSAAGGQFLGRYTRADAPGAVGGSRDANAIGSFRLNATGELPMPLPVDEPWPLLTCGVGLVAYGMLRGRRQLIGAR